MERNDKTIDRKALLLKRITKCARKMKETSEAMLEYAANIRNLAAATAIQSRSIELAGASKIIRSWGRELKKISENSND